MNILSNHWLNPGIQAGDGPGLVKGITLGGSDSEESSCNAGDLGSIPGSGRSPGGGHGNPLQYSCVENPHGQRSPGGATVMGSQRVRHELSD